MRSHLYFIILVGFIIAAVMAIDLTVDGHTEIPFITTTITALIAFRVYWRTVFSDD